MHRAYMVVFLCVLATAAQAQSATSSSASALEPQVDAIASKVLRDTGVPSASIAVVREGKVVLRKAYGYADIATQRNATPDMRYSIGSVSKQFTATAILWLQQQGKLSLDDKVAKYLPELTRADEVTIRQLLSHTSGYGDYAPQDYIPGWMLKPATAQEILDGWAKKPLEFNPGDRWQYSNTNYVIAGAIVEKVSGMKLFDVLERLVFRPLDMQSAFNADQNHNNPDVTGYFRYALGPQRPAPKEGPGWMFAAGELSMTAPDLAKWDISVMNQTILQPQSYRQMETEVLLNNGAGTRYGLGLDISRIAGHRALEHSGEVSGFVSDNIVLPDDKEAVVVLTNEDASRAAGNIGQQIANYLVQQQRSSAGNAIATAKQIFVDLQQGKIDRQQFTADANGYFTEEAINDYRASLGPLGAPAAFEMTSEGGRGGMMNRNFRVSAGGRELTVSTYVMPDGKYEQYLVIPVE